MQISFLAGENFTIQNLGGSGLGFYGPGGFGTSVQVGAFQDNTYITDSTGALQGPQVANVKWVHPNSGMIPTNNTLLLRQIPNYEATLNIRATNPTPVKIQDATITIFDRTNPNNPPVGVTCMVAQIIHPWNTQSPNGSGDTAWWMPGGSGGMINGFEWDGPVGLANSPGTSGWSPSGAATTDTTHDWYVILSPMPLSIGSHSQFGLYISLEYL